MRNTSRKALILLLPLVTAVLISCTWQQPVFVAFNNPQLEYMGRTGRDTDATLIYWPGTSITMNFEGTAVNALLKDEKGLNYFNVIVDGGVISKLKADTAKQLCLLADGLKPGKHIVQLFKITEGTMGKTWFYGFRLPDNGKALAKPPLPKRKIEFYGNSITSGYSAEDTAGDSNAGKYFNNYLSYAAVTARHYNAAYHCISKSGIGLMVSWFPVIMPEMYDRIDPANPGSKWDFAKYTPDIVVINLFQNDSWLVTKPDHEQFKARFGLMPPGENDIVGAYANFVKTIRLKYPKAYIICVLGSMDATRQGSPWPGYIEKAATSLNDPKVFTHFFPYKKTPGHPKVKDHHAMAESLIGFIDSHIKW